MKHKIAAAVAIVVFVAVHFVSFPGSVPDFRRASGGGTLLDMTPEFSEDALYARLTGYGAAGRSNYAFRTVTVDVVLPLALLPFLFLWMRIALNRLSLGARPAVDSTARSGVDVWGAGIYFGVSRLCAD